MIQTEAASLVAYLNRAGLLWAMEGQAAVWADALADVSYVTAQEVVRSMAATRTSGSRSVVPGDVRDAVRIIRHDRLKDMRSPEPPQELDGHPARELAWQRAYRTAIGDGQDEAQADRTACHAVSVTRLAIEAAPRPVTAALEGHKAGCRCGCLTRPVRAEEGRERR